MSFYNVTNPANFQVIDDSRLPLAPFSTVTHVDATQNFTAAATLTAPQTIAGAVIWSGTATGALTLPSASNLLQLLQSGSYASQQFGVDDLLYLDVVNIGSQAVVMTSGSTASTRAVASLANTNLTIKFTNVTAGSEAYTIY
jgi:hypothetical protein